MTPSDTQQFLDALFGGKPDDLYILLWLLRDKSSHWFTDLDQAARFAEAHSAEDVYAGAALSRADYGPKCRLTLSGERPPAGIVGLWADIDIAGEAHTKPDLPPTAEAATKILPRDVRPTLAVHSGHGLQFWWLFKEPWIFETPEEMEQAAILEARWLALLQRRAGAHGWVIDPVSDLTRVMRLPGTTNNKIPGRPVPAQIIPLDWGDGRPVSRYNPSDFEAALEGIPAPNRTPAARGRAPEAGPLRLDPNAEVSPDLIAMLRHVDPRFDATWRRERPDLQDQSQSSYDMALAWVGVTAGLTDQQVADMLIQHRRMHGQPPKLRQDYYQGTIQKARLTSRGPAEESDTADELGAGADDTRQPAAPLSREKAQQALERLLKLSVVTLRKHGATKGEFVLHLTGGEAVALGDANTLESQRRFRVAVIDGLNVQLPLLKPPKWRQAVNALLTLVEVVPTLSSSDLIQEWLSDFFRGHSVHHLHSIRDGCQATTEAFERLRGDGCLVGAICESQSGGVAIFRLRDLFKHIGLSFNAKLSQPDLAIMLSKVGFQPRSTVSSPTWEGRRIKVNRVWVGPADFVRTDREARRSLVSRGKRSEPASLSEEMVN